MRVLRVAVVAGVTAWVGMAGCDTWSVLGPDDVEDVSISLGVYGGIAGMSLSFVVDGAEGEVRGGHCGNLCDWEPGEVLLPISDAQVAELAGRLERAGIFDLAGDYGDGCCDLIGVELTYRRGDRTARVEGATLRMPGPLRESIGILSTLGYRQLPMLVAPDTRHSDWPRSPYTLGSVEARGLSVTTEVTYGGGCAPHRMDLVAVGDWIASDPVQVNALVTHDDGGDMCEALVTEERVFDLSPLLLAHRSAYGPTDGPVRIVLRLWDPVSGSPAGRLIELEL